MNLSVILWIVFIILVIELSIYLRRRYYSSERIQRNFYNYLPYIRVVFKNPFEDVVKKGEVRFEELKEIEKRRVKIPDKAVIITRKSLDNFVASSLLLRILGGETPIKLANEWNFVKIIESYYFSQEKDLSLILMDFPFSKTIHPILGALVRSYLKERGSIYWFDKNVYEKRNPILNISNFYLIEGNNDVTYSELVRRSFNMNDPYSYEMLQLLSEDNENRKFFSYWLVFQELIEQNFNEDLIKIYLNKLAFEQKISKLGMYRRARSRYNYTKELLERSNPLIYLAKGGRKFALIDLRRVRLERMNSFNVVVIALIEPFSYFYREAIERWEVDLVLALRTNNSILIKFRDDPTIKKDYLFKEIIDRLDVKIGKNFNLDTYEIKWVKSWTDKIKYLINLKINGNILVKKLVEIIEEELV